MTGFLVQTGAAMICPHGGQVSGIPSNVRVLLNGQPALTQTDTFVIYGCLFSIPSPGGPIPHPCVLAKWLVPSLRIKASGQPVILQTSTGICQAPDQLPQGPPAVITTQIKASAE